MYYLLIVSAIALILLLACLDWLHYTIRRRKYLRGVPSLPFVPIIGNILELSNLKDLFILGLKYCDRYGKVFLLRIFMIEFLVVTDTKWTETILTSTKFISKAKEYSLLEKWLGDGLLLSKGEKWRKDRKFLTPAFHFNNLPQFVHSFNTAGDILVRKLKKEVGKPTAIFPYVTLCMLDVICESIMGIYFNAQLSKKSKYVTSVDYIKQTVFRRIISGWKLIDLIYPLSFDYWKDRRALKVLHDTTDAVIKERRKYLLDNLDDNKHGKGSTFLDMLLKGTIDGKPLTDKEIREQVDTFLFEGHDTTTSALCFTLWNLSKHMDIQEKIVDEIRSVIGTEKNLTLTYKNLLDLKYLTMVIKESLRIFPSVPIIGRTVDEDAMIDGVLLPKGLRVFIPILAIHIYNDADFNEFKPERFLNENWNNEKLFTYLPFSAGYRNCIGQKFAMLELKAILAKLIVNFKVFPTKDYGSGSPNIMPDIVLKPTNGLSLRFELRHD